MCFENILFEFCDDDGGACTNGVGLAVTWAAIGLPRLIWLYRGGDDDDDDDDGVAVAVDVAAAAGVVVTFGGWYWLAGFNDVISDFWCRCWCCDCWLNDADDDCGDDGEEEPNWL